MFHFSVVIDRVFQLVGHVLNYLYEVPMFFEVCFLRRAHWSDFVWYGVSENPCGGVHVRSIVRVTRYGTGLEIVNSGEVMSCIVLGDRVYGERFCLVIFILILGLGQIESSGGRCAWMRHRYEEPGKGRLRSQIRSTQCWCVGKVFFPSFYKVKAAGLVSSKILWFFLWCFPSLKQQTRPYTGEARWLHLVWNFQVSQSDEIEDNKNGICDSKTFL